MIITEWLRVLGLDISGELRGVTAVTLVECEICGLLYFDPPRAGSGQLYSALQRYDWYYEPAKWEYTQAKQHLSQNDRVLEIGCGTGAFRDQIPCERYVALELNDEAVAACQGRGLDVRHEDIARHADSHPGAYDVVVAFQVLEHVESPRAVLEAAVECLRSGGQLIVAVPSADSYLRHTQNNILNMPPHHQSWWGVNTLSGLPELLPIVLCRLEREPLGGRHLGAFLTTVVDMAITARYQRTRKVVDRSVSSRLRRYLSRRLAAVLTPALADVSMRPTGNTVLAVYRRA